MTSTTLKRRIVFASYPVVVSISMVSLLSGLVFLLWPGVIVEASIGQTLQPWMRPLWSMAYAAGGALVVAGFWRLNSRLEVLGLLMLACCYLLNCYSIFAFRGISTGIVSASVFAGLCIGFTWRAWLLSTEPHHLLG